MDKQIDLDNRAVDIEKDDTQDKDMEKLLAILHDTPEVKIPERFEQRFSQVLKAEGSKIREEKRMAAANKKRKWYLKVAATAAACFVVVFASVSMYNDGIGPDSGRIASEESAETQMSLSGDMFNDATEEGASKDAVISTEGIQEKEDLNLSAEQATIALGRVDAEYRGESDGNEQDTGQAEIYYGMQSSEVDTLCREGSKYAEATEEYWAYRRLVDEYLTGYEFTVTDCQRDEDTGSYLFEVHIVMDPEGQIVDESLILRGEQGEIHESENSTEGDEPQTGSD